VSRRDEDGPRVDWQRVKRLISMVLDRHRMVKVEWSVGRHYCQHQLMTRCDDFVVVELDHDVSSFDDYYYYCSSKNHPSRVEIITQRLIA
jgi:hypothetical protein